MGVSVLLLRHLLHTGTVTPSFKVVSDGIPADAVVVGVQILDGQTIWVTFSSSEFPEVKEGHEIPILNTTFETDNAAAGVL